MQLSIDTAALLVALGGVAFLTINRLLIDRTLKHRPRDYFLPIGGAALVFMVARVVQRTTGDLDGALLASRVQYVAAVGIVYLGLLELPTRMRGERRRRLLVFVGAGAIAVGGLAMTSLVAQSPTLRVDLFDHHYLAPRPGPLNWIVGVYAATAVVVAWRLLRSAPRSEVPRARYVLIVGVFALAGANEILMVSGVIRSVHTFEFAFLAFIVLASYKRQHHLESVNADLERLVAERTQDLELALSDLTAKERRVRAIAEAANEGVLFVSSEQVITTCNQVLCTLTKRPESALVGKRVTDLFDPRDSQGISEVISGASQKVVEAHLLRGEHAPASPAADDNDKTPDKSGSPGEGDDKLLVEVLASASPGVVLVRDISAQREIQHRMVQTDRLAAMGTLAAGTAHEINNPLAYIVGNAELLGDWMDTLQLPREQIAEPRAMVDDMLTGSLQVARIVKDLMSLGRDKPNDRGPANIVDIVESSLSIASPQIRHRATLIRDFAPDLPKVAASPLRLSQVFLNLFLNAVHAMPEGERRQNELRVRIRANDGMVQVDVEDNGVGIPEEIRNRIFDPFFTTKPVGQGTGLGLAVSHGIVTSLGGRIRAHPLERGTRFSVEIPTVEAYAAIPKETVDDPRSQPTRKKVLVADDEQNVCKLISRILADYAVTTVHDGASVVERCKQESFDVIICDLMMPNLTGMEVYDELARTNPKLARRMVFITGGVFTESARSFLESQAPCWLEKPLASRELKAQVERMLTIHTTTGEIPVALPS